MILSFTMSYQWTEVEEVWICESVIGAAVAAIDETVVVRTSETASAAVAAETRCASGEDHAIAKNVKKSHLIDETDGTARRRRNESGHDHGIVVTVVTVMIGIDPSGNAIDVTKSARNENPILKRARSKSKKNPSTVSHFPFFQYFLYRDIESNCVCCCKFYQGKYFRQYICIVMFA